MSINYVLIRNNTVADQCGSHGVNNTITQHKTILYCIMGWLRIYVYDGYWIFILHCYIATILFVRHAPKKATIAPTGCALHLINNIKIFLRTLSANHSYRTISHIFFFQLPYTIIYTNMNLQATILSYFSLFHSHLAIGISVARRIKIWLHILCGGSVHSILKSARFIVVEY